MADSRATNLLCLGLTICILFACAYALGDNYSVHIIANVCKSYSDLLYNVTCTHKSLNWTAANDTLEIFIKPGVKFHNVFVAATILVRNNNMRYVPRYIINSTIDLCAGLAGDTSNPLAVIIVKFLEKRSNFYHPCPLSVCTRAAKAFYQNNHNIYGFHVVVGILTHRFIRGGG